MGGKGGSNLAMAVIREHLAAKGLGLHNDLQNEHSIVGNNPFVLMFKAFATPEQVERYGDDLLSGKIRATFGLTEPDHGSDATFMETRAVRQEKDGKPGWLINGEKMWTTGMHAATHCMVFARTSGNDGDATGITVFLVPANDPGVKIEEYLWTFNMPTDHPRVSFTNIWVPDEAIWGVEGRGLGLGQSFVHQNRIRQAASSLGAAVFCIEESVKYARARKPFGEELSRNQAIQFPLVELATQCEMLRLLIRKTAWEMDHLDHKEIERQISDKVSMCNYWANRLVLRGGRPGHAGARRHRLFPAQALRAHLSPPPPLPHHRGQRGDPDAQGRRLPVRLPGPAPQADERAHLGRRRLPQGPHHRPGARLPARARPGGADAARPFEPLRRR